MIRTPGFEGRQRDALVGAVEHRVVVVALGQHQRREAVAGHPQPGELLGVGGAAHAVGHDDRARVLRQQGTGHAGHDRGVERGLQRYPLVYVLPGHIRPGELVHGGHELVLAARQDPAVHVADRLAGDDVDLVARLQHGRVGAVADRPGHQGGPGAEPGQQFFRPQVASGRGPAGRRGDGVDRRAHGGDQPDRPRVSPDPRHRGAQPDHRILRIGLGAVPGPAPRRQLHPGGAPLGRGDRVEPLTVPGVEREGPRLADRLGAPFEQPGMPLHQPL